MTARFQNTNWYKKSNSRGLENTVEPPEAKGEVEGIMARVMNKAWSSFSELFKQMSIPEGAPSFTLMNTNVKPLKSNHFQAANWSQHC